MKSILEKREFKDSAEAQGQKPHARTVRHTDPYSPYGAGTGIVKSLSLRGGRAEEKR